MQSHRLHGQTDMWRTNHNREFCYRQDYLIEKKISWKTNVVMILKQNHFILLKTWNKTNQSKIVKFPERSVNISELG